MGRQRLEGNRARLWVAGTETVLGPGDYLFIPAHTPHRVLETSDTPPCLWLAVHVHGDDGGGVRPPADPAARRCTHPAAAR